MIIFVSDGFPSKSFPSKMKSITTVNIARHFLHHNASFPRPRLPSASRSFPMQKFCNSFTSASLSVVQVGCWLAGSGSWRLVLCPELETCSQLSPDYNKPVPPARAWPRSPPASVSILPHVLLFYFRMVLSQLDNPLAHSLHNNTQLEHGS